MNQSVCLWLDFRERSPNTKYIKLFHIAGYSGELERDLELAAEAGRGGGEAEPSLLAEAAIGDCDLDRASSFPFSCGEGDLERLRDLSRLVFEWLRERSLLLLERLRERS